MNLKKRDFKGVNIRVNEELKNRVEKYCNRERRTIGGFYDIAAEELLKKLIQKSPLKQKPNEKAI